MGNDNVDNDKLDDSMKYRKKFKQYSITLFGIFVAMASCNKDNTVIAPTPVEKGLSSISASIFNFRSEILVGDMTPITRSAFVTDEYGDVQLVWAEKDTIGIYSSSGLQIPLPLGIEAGKKAAFFEGDGLGIGADSLYSAYTPYIDSQHLKINQIPLNLLAQTQNGNGSFEHLSKYDFMAAINAIINQNGAVDFNFEHLVAILHLQIKMPKGGVYKYVILETSDKFTTEGMLDLSDGTVTKTKHSPIQVMKLENLNVTESEDGFILNLYMFILPVDLTDKILYAKIYDTDNNCYSATMQAKNFEAGVIYNSTIIATEDLTHSGLPVVIISTPDNQEVISKEEYVENTLLSIYQVDEMDEICEITGIKGRGHSTWTPEKKPYAIKLRKKKPILSLPENKSWVLLANYFDPTHLRNSTALYIGSEISSLEWTPHYHYVDLMLNGVYKGIYQLGEKIKVSRGRVNDGEDGFLMEIDQHALTEMDARYFTVTHLDYPINIKEPDVEYNDEDYNYVKGFVIEAEKALYSESFTNSEIGWKNYFDMNSLVEWYLINEISRNADACTMFSSCYMYLKRGGKIKMGPIWDYDLAFGGYPISWSGTAGDWENNPKGFMLKDYGWFSRFFSDPTFVNQIKERFNYYYENGYKILDFIDSNATLLEDKIAKENKLYGQILYPASDSEVKAYYQHIVDELKTWINTRFEWLYENINSL